MIKSFFASRKWAVWAYGGLVLLFGGVVYQVTLIAWINEWYKSFYDLLQQGGTIEVVTGMEQFWQGMMDFCWLAGPYIVTAAVVNWFARIYAIRWRQAITFDYIPRWIKTNSNIEGASQRIQEDCAKWAEMIQGLGLQVIRAILTLIVFIPILYALIGWLVWVAIGATIGGMVVSWFVGYWLPGLEYNNQKTEAAFRKELVYGEDDRVLMVHETLASLFTGLRLNHQRLYSHYGYFDLWVYLYGQGMSILPYLVAGPMLIKGVITLGSLIQISNAFSKVHGSMSLFIENWVTITAARSVWKRLREFERSI